MLPLWAAACNALPTSRPKARGKAARYSEAAERWQQQGNKGGKRRRGAVGKQQCKKRWSRLRANGSWRPETQLQPGKAKAERKKGEGGSMEKMHQRAWAGADAEGVNG